MKYIAFCLVLIGVLFSQTPAQSLLGSNGEIPSDLLISLVHQSGAQYGQYTSKITIDATGKISSEFQSQGGLPAFPTVKLYPEKKITRPKNVSQEKLRNLIREFEKSQFFRFGADFPVEEGVAYSTTHQDTEEISIRVNGQTKTVSNYLGDSLKRTRMLRELAVRISSAGLWDQQDGKIPEDFEVTYRSTTGEWIERDIRIGADGTITRNFYMLKPTPGGARAVSALTGSKTAGRLSWEQLVRLMNEFESAAFSIFYNTEMNKYYGCTNDPTPGPLKSEAIGVRIWGGYMWASLYKGCGAWPETEAARFEHMQTVIQDVLKKAKVL